MYWIGRRLYSFTVLGLAVLGMVGCARTQTMVHQPSLTDGMAFELGGVYSPDEELDGVRSPESKSIQTEGDKTGYSALVQFANFYFRVDAAPLPGSWLGIAWTKKASRWLWSPSLEISGSPSGFEEETADAFLEDEAGNRYLYEVKRKRSGIGLALPQVIEFYPMRRLGIYFAAVPGMINSSQSTEVELVYERERRIVAADPALDAEFQDLVKKELRTDRSDTRWLMPLMVGVRSRIGPMHLRFQYADRSIDSVKNFEASFRRIFVLSLGYVLEIDTKRYKPTTPSPTAPDKGST